MTFIEKLEKAIKKNNSLLCIGLDPEFKRLKDFSLQTKDPVFEFNKKIIDATYDLVCCYKPQIAFYSALGVYGLKSLEKTIEYIQTNYSDIPVILDAKRGDIGSTATQYTLEAFEALKADAVTVNPYLGHDSIKPFLEYKNKGIIILCRTSNPSATDIQDLMVENQPLYITVAKKIVSWNTNNNCLMVVGATYPEELKKIRDIAPDMFFLVPGIGAQGGDLEKTLQNGLRNDKSGLIISSSRGILFAGKGSGFEKKSRDEAIKLRNSINHYRNI